jgi:hypothetical protein
MSPVVHSFVCADSMLGADLKYYSSVCRVFEPRLALIDLF